MPTPNTGIPYVPENTTDPAAGLNLALNVIDALLQTAVLNMNLTAPPGSPTDGDLHIVAGSATGAWAGEDNNLARYVADGDFWQFYEAGVNVHLVLNQDDGGLYAFDGSSAWVPAVAGGGGGATAVTIITEASTSTMDPATHAGLNRWILAADDVTFDSAEGYSAGEVYPITATAGLTLIGTGVTLTPPAGGTLALDADMSVEVRMTSSTAGRLIGQTVPA